MKSLATCGGNLNKTRAFTFIELLLVLGIAAVVGVVVTPLYGNLKVTTDLNEETSQLVATIRLARERALGGWHGARHGVCFEFPANLPPHYLIYEGASCATRVMGAERTVDLSLAINLTTSWPATDINFNPIGLPSATGTITLTHQTTGTRQIEINDLGRVAEI
ncbi:MAG: GspH/FimT family protein [Patescibacteria group bacterium]